VENGEGRDIEIEGRERKREREKSVILFVLCEMII